jgi:hypothetical protein
MALVHPFSSSNINIDLLNDISLSSLFSLSPPPTPPKDTPYSRPLLPIYLTMSSSHERTLSDEELDLEWEKANIGRTTSPRPQSLVYTFGGLRVKLIVYRTMARSFSLALNDLFKIDSSIADLDAKVDQKYVAFTCQSTPTNSVDITTIHMEEQHTDILYANRKKAVSSQTSELEALEARIRATEERLKSLSTSSSPTQTTTTPSSASLAAQNRLSGRSSPRPRPAIGETFDAQKSPLAQNEFRPSSANRPKSRREDTVQTRGLPPTPGQSEGETSSSEEESEEGGDIQRDVRRGRNVV